MDSFSAAVFSSLTMSYALARAAPGLESSKCKSSGWVDVKGWCIAMYLCGEGTHKKKDAYYQTTLQMMMREGEGAHWTQH